MKKTTLILSVFVVALALGACSKSARLPSTVTVAQTKNESSKKANVVLGDTLLIEMPGLMVDGYRWELLPLPPAEAETAGLVMVEGRYTPPAKPGAQGKFTYVMRTVHVGAQSLEFVYRRPAEPGKPPAKTFTVNAMVR